MTTDLAVPPPRSAEKRVRSARWMVSRVASRHGWNGRLPAKTSGSTWRRGTTLGAGVVVAPGGTLAARAHGRRSDPFRL